MEPLAPAVLAALTPPDLEIRFWDDRLEPIPFDEPTDLVAMSVETYTAKRSYQIASEYRRRRVPVVMGGFHPTLRPEEAMRYAETIVVGEAEEQWPTLVDDFRHGSLQRVYTAEGRANTSGVLADRRLFRGKRYLPVRLVETSRGCHLKCDFCAIQSYFDSTHVRRPVDDVVTEIEQCGGRGKFFFFVDDNIASSAEGAKELYRALIPLGIRWVSQASMHVAHDEEMLDLMVRSGCQGLLIGFESTDEETLRGMRKSFNTMRGGYDVALANLRRHRIRLYPTFIFGYDRDEPAAFARTMEFAKHHRFYIAAFNHITPFPGTPLYERLEREGRLLYDAWWTDPRYRYNDVPFRPSGVTAEELRRLCIDARAEFYSWGSIARRFIDRVNSSDPFMARNFPWINLMLRREVHQRDRLPLGEVGWRGELIPATGGSSIAV
jgi:radical SAM superfamily enzyme YgiQ (UPF0313 family)